jgi:methanogenic corrinoid protein MtbC1
MQSMPHGQEQEPSGSPQGCEADVPYWHSMPSPGTVWESLAEERRSSRGRMAALARAIEVEVIPRLVRSLGEPSTAPSARPTALPDVPRFVSIVLEGSDKEVAAAVRRWHLKAGSVTSVYLDLLAPAARHLGVLWEQDRCDFASVTVALGRLQQLLRAWSPSFGTEVQHPPNGRRILLAQHAREQHCLGLAMVGDFFRRSGWEVLGGPAGAGMDEVGSIEALKHEWFDAVGFSIGSELRLDWLTLRVAQVRQLSRNRGVLVLVGGPLLTLHPEWVARVGADASGHDGARAPELAESLLAARATLG